MALSREECSALIAYCKLGSLTQRDIAAKLSCSLGKANSVCQSLARCGFIDQGRITSEGIAALEPYKVENAIIMAAGLSSRFAPVSYELPKGLLKVHGEVLIERQIKQLQEAGIPEIIVVVGYKKELFFYLEEKFGVKIVVNHEFASRNNHATLMRVRESLGNSYICSSDNYFTTNPFESHVWMSYYAAQYSEAPTQEWCITTNSKGFIESVQIGKDHTWYMIGHAFFNRAFSARFSQILEAEYNNPRSANKLWEDIFLEHTAELPMEIRQYPHGAIYEFNTFDDVRKFDSFFLENLDSDIFNNIASILGCSIDEIHDVYPLKQGLTNLSCHFATNSGEYVYRHPGVGTEKMIDRAAEVQAQTLAKAIGIDDTFIFEDPDTGWKISRFIPNCRLLDSHDPAQVAEAMAMARALHAQDISLRREFDYFAEGKKYESLLLKKGPITISDYDEMAHAAKKLKAFTQADGAKHCVTHNDFFNLNLLYDEAGMLYLIDWEYAGMADYASDYGTFVVTCMLSEEEADAALTSYFGRTPTPEEARHNYAFVALAGWCWYVWALQKESEGDYVGEWLYTYYKYAKRYAAKALACYEQA